MGVYPLLLDETCWFLAVDFDGESWQDDSLAFLSVSDAIGVPAYLERSRSGRGGHVWVFFDSPVSAAIARDLGAAILTRAMDARCQMSFASYDRFFPNQSTMPKGGFGNLIALPLQHGPRKLGNSVFVNRDFEPCADQWAYLAQIRRMSAQAAAELVRRSAVDDGITGVPASVVDASGDDAAAAVDPWLLSPSRQRTDKPIPGPLPKSVRVVQANMVYIDKQGLPPAMITRLRRLAAFQNPEFYSAQRMRLSTYGQPRVICCAEDFPEYAALPRGCLDRAIDLLSEHGISPIVQDHRYGGVPEEFVFLGQLNPRQEDAVRVLSSFDDGVFSAPTGFGKTVIAAWMIAHRKVNTLVLVHRRQLLDQWRAQLSAFLGLGSDSIGQIGGGKVAPTGALDVGMIQSLNRGGEVDDIVAAYGHVVVDECHHISAVSFEQVLRSVKAKYILGLTATPIRKDGRHPIIMMQCGPLRARLSPRTASRGQFEHVVIPRATEFRLPDGAADATIQQIYGMLAGDPDRNAMIIADVIQAVRAGRSPLVLTERTAHLKELVEGLKGYVANIIVLRGGRTDRQRRQLAATLAAVPDCQERVIVATGRYAGEGFDDARLDTLFLALPISWKGTLQQYAGRLHRSYEGKRIVQVYDYVDAYVSVLSRMYERRLRGYKAMGYVVTDADPVRPADGSLSGLF
jgi:superfamily II DNA or RNA helicase